MVELYIDGHKADLTTTVSVPMNYELEKLENPTIIKNNFSKTISLQATPNNNRIFGYYYELGKVHNGTGFNAIKRIPFELYRDSDLIETGYLQLNNIKHKDNTYTYEITLYGGLGDFLYSLAYDEEGNDKTLADLNYGWGENDEGFQFKMCAETVKYSWDFLSYGVDDELLGGTVTFVPSYNGLYEDFDNNKVLVNTNGQTALPSSFTADNKTYKTINGYGMVEMKNELNEWEIRDLRCYKQRPALRVKEFIKAICRPENNGGYEVELDEKWFFHRDNSYYENTWITLPLLNPDSEKWPTTPTEINASGPTNISFTMTANTKTANITLSGSNGTLIDEFGGNSNIDVICDFSMSTIASSSADKLILSRGGENPHWKGIGVWMEATVNGTVVGISDCMVFTKAMTKKVKEKRKGDRRKKWYSYFVMPNISHFDACSQFPKTNFIYYDGEFIKQNGNTYVFEGTPYYDGTFWGNAGNTFRIQLNDIPNYEGLEFTIKTDVWYNYDSYDTTTAINPWGQTDYIKIPSSWLYDYSGNFITPTSVSVSNIVFPKAEIRINEKNPTLQNVNITKHQLLKNKITPASLLLSYTKLFGLYFVKDAKKKHIKILTKNSFFENAEIIDIDDKVDYSNDVKIEPLMFDKKWYSLKCPALETTLMKDYKADYYEAEYGQKRINTNYNFNTDTKDLYSDNQYQNVITILDSSKYYKNMFYKNKTSEYVPTFSIDGFTYKLWENADIDSVGDKEYKRKDLMTTTEDPIPFGTLVGQDYFSKICCYDKEDDKKNLNDLSVSLVFYNYDQYVKDIEGHNVWYTISDDLPIMNTVNEGTPMYLWSNSEYNADGEQICYRTNTLPQFTRYDLQGGNVYKSLDFGVPYETYINGTYSEGATLYNRFWQRFYNDQFSENTRKVSAYVYFNDIELGNHSLSNFYYFNNCYWLLNKIIDYDIANPQKKVKCEFIKVNSISNYTEGQTLEAVWFEFQPEIDAMDDWDVLTDYYLTYGSEIICRFKPQGGIQTLEVDIGGLTKEEVNERLNLKEEENGYYTLTISDIRGDVGLYISGFWRIESTINYSVNTTPPTAASSKTIQLAVGPNKEIVWANPVDDSDVMDIEMWDSNEMYYRIIPNAYGTSNRLSFSATITLYFTDGTSVKTTSSQTTDSWTRLPQFEYWKTVDSIHIQVTKMSMLS